MSSLSRPNISLRRNLGGMVRRRGRVERWMLLVAAYCGAVLLGVTFADFHIRFDEGTFRDRLEARTAKTDVSVQFAATAPKLVFAPQRRID